MQDPNDFMNRYMAEYHSEEKRQAQLHAAYMDDLRETLKSPAGLRVLRRWLDDASVFGITSSGSELSIVQEAAVANYGKTKLQEIAAASQQGFINIMLAGLGSDPGLP